jgi:hypothetical protein
MIRQKPMSRAAQLRLRKMFPVYDTPGFAFHNNGDLTFTEVGHSWGFDARRVSQGIALADLDNDGDLDVLLTGNGGSLVYTNNGNNSFSAKSQISLKSVSGAYSAWGDYNMTAVWIFYLPGTPQIVRYQRFTEMMPTLLLQKLREHI